MKRFILAFVSVALVAFVTFLLIDFSPNDGEIDVMEQKRVKHRKFLAESPFNETKNLTKTERKELGLPPNAYNERLWELTMNPDLGYPTPFKVEPIDVGLIQQKASPGSVTSPWIERGPLNVGGRTRVVFFDPNDVGDNNGDGVDYNRVFAGGVGGGLWVNNNINSLTSRWSIVSGLAANLSVSAYAIDPNDSQIIYIGTGEQYTDGAAIGSGLYKSTDGGVNWENVEIEVAGDESASNDESLFKAGIFHINDIIARDVSGTTEVYVAVGASLYSSPNFSTQNPVNFLGLSNAGIYRSIDNGQNWARNESIILQIFTENGRFPVIPNDFEITADGMLYMSSINSPGINTGGGRIYRSTNGTTWSLAQNIAGASRVEIATSATDSDKIYALANVTGQADIFVTDNGFSTFSNLNEPDDADNGIPASDFTRGQAFYDLVIEVNPTNDDEVYVGGINIHRTRNGGDTWQQMSKWSQNPNMNQLNVPFVHADIHAISFQPNNVNRALIGSDGGVSIATNLNRTVLTENDIQNRNFGYNVTQFYYGDINQLGADDGDDFVGGTQDNGSPIIDRSIVGPLLSSSFDPLGGDGSYSAIDDEGNYAVLGYTSRTHIYLEYPITGSSSSYFISNDNDGDFINVAELDSQFDILFANSRTSTGANSITACELGPNSADCTELVAGAISEARPTAMKASPFSVGTPTLYVGSQDSRVFRIENAQNNQQKVIRNISSPDFLGSVSDIEFGETELEIYVTFHNYGVNNVWFTNDGGLTWAQKDGNLPDIPVKAILRNPLVPNEVIIGTQQGIFSTSDFDSASPTWTPSINGMTNVPVYDLDLRTADNTVLATTHGRGLFTGKFTADTASITAPLDENQLKVFPTQATSEIFISTKLNYNNADVTIFNLNGQQVYQQKKSLSSSRQRIDVSGLSTGLYLLKVRGNGIDQTVKFVKE